MPDPEHARVEALIARDRVDRSREMDRKLAEHEVAAGVFVNLSDAVLEPTPEWLGKGETRTFYPRQLDETTRVIKTVRRVVTPITTRMHRAGKLSDEQSAACDWYRDCYEAAGLDGRYKTSSLGSTGGGGTGLSCHPMARHAHEVEAREAFRKARKALPEHFLRGFDAVVLGDLPLRRAARFIRSDNSKIYYVFSTTCNKLVVWCQTNGIELA